MLQMRRPGVRLHLAKTVVPLTPPSSTHAYCIITSQSSKDIASTSSETSTSPGLRSPFFPESRFPTPRNRSSVASTEMASTEMRTSFSSDATLSHATEATAGSYFPQSNITRSSHRPKAKAGRRSPFSERPVLQMQMQTAAEACWQLVETIDWSQTKLGPRSDWDEAVDPLLAVVFQSQTQDSLWLGEDLQIF